MKNLNYCILLIGLLLGLSGVRAFAESVPFQTSEVNATNPNKCVEYYYNINGKAYCSNKATAPIPSLKSAADYEKAILSFDNRNWKLAWWNEVPLQPTFEYVLESDDINGWSELVTSQFIPDIQNQTTPQQLMMRFLSVLSSQGFKPQVKVISQSPTDILYEWIITNTPSQDQHELQRIVMGREGLLVLHYASRPTMSKEHREVWIQLLSQTKVK